MNRITKTVLLSAAIVLAIGAAREALSQSGEHGDGHAQSHDIYRSWKMPSNPSVSCCSDEDCRPTRAKMDEHGNWLAWNGDKWLNVPWKALLPANIAGDGRSHLCEKNGLVYCFSPAEPKS